MTLSDVTERISGWGSQPLVSTPEQVAALSAAEFTTFAKIIKCKDQRSVFQTLSEFAGFTGSYRLRIQPVIQSGWLVTVVSRL